MSEFPIVERLLADTFVLSDAREAANLIRDLVEALEQIELLERGDGSFERDAIEAYRISRAVLAKAKRLI